MKASHHKGKRVRKEERNGDELQNQAENNEQNLLTTALNVNRPTSPIKRHRVAKGNKTKQNKNKQQQQQQQQQTRI